MAKKEEGYTIHDAACSCGSPLVHAETIIDRATELCSIIRSFVNEIEVDDGMADTKLGKLVKEAIRTLEKYEFNGWIK